MSELSPAQAALLANQVYRIQNELLLEPFLGMSFFKKAQKGAANPNMHLKAEVGGRIINNHKDGFGVCVPLVVSKIKINCF